MSADRDGRRIEGRAVLQGGRGPVFAATVDIRLLDVTNADAAARVVGESRLHDVTFVPGEGVPFSLDIPPDVDITSRYEVAVHARVSGSNEIATGDLLSMISTPVSVERSTSSLSVFVQQVES